MELFFNLRVVLGRQIDMKQFKSIFVEISSIGLNIGFDFLRRVKQELTGIGI